MDSRLKQTLKANAHHLKPVVLLGTKGLTAAIIEETNLALMAHELIKIKISGIEKAERRVLAITVCQEVEAELIQLIGNIAVLYRKKKAG